ncbi:suppressor APC domain-containing protein 1 [Aplochiton taeniatus]
MACPASYTVVIIPLRTSLYSLDALRFYLWAASCLLRSCVQRVNGSLGSLMSEPNVSSSTQSLLDTVADSNLRWQNTVLVKEVGEKNKQISILEMERNRLLLQLGELSAH